MKLSEKLMNIRGYHCDIGEEVINGAEALEAQIESMRNCDNCLHGSYHLNDKATLCQLDDPNECDDDYSLWELGE